MTNNITVTNDDTELPERGFTSEGVFWKAEDYDDVNFHDGHVHVSTYEQPIQLGEIRVDGVSIANMDLMNEIMWEEVFSAVVVHSSEGWEVLVLVGKDDDGVFKVAIPTFIFHDENVPEQMRIEFAKILKSLDEAGRLSVIEDNMDVVLSWAN